MDKFDVDELIIGLEMAAATDFDNFDTESIEYQAAQKLREYQEKEKNLLKPFLVNI